jgi:signal transduction histidine kinase
MWILMKFVWMKLWWRMLTRLLRSLGWGAWLVPVAAMGMAVFGVSLWTVAAVVLAVTVAVRRPAMAAVLVPVTMVCLGVSGLLVAAATPGVPVYWASRSFSYTVLPVNGSLTRWFSGLPAGARLGQVPAVGGPASVTVRKPAGGGIAVRTTVGKMAMPRVAVGGMAGPGYAGMKLQPLPKPAPPAPPASFVKANWIIRGGTVPPVKRGPRRAHTHNPGWWRGRLLVPVALILLTLGLCLAPRTLVALRARLATQDSDLRTWMRENRWGLLLVPVTVVGLSVFGVRPWTIAAVITALILVVKWPKVAADLVPLALAALAVRGFVLAANWQSLAPRGPGPLAGPSGPRVMYGALFVDSRPMALLAGAEASTLLAFGAWLIPRTIAAHVRTLLARDPDPDLAGLVQRLTETRSQAVDAAASELRRIERDLHDGAQARLVALGMNLRAVERMLPASPQAALALVAEARETSLRALTELRDLIRGICPPVLADRGLGHAVRALALDTPLPVELDIDLPGRLAAPVESACYFAVAEALANAVKHAGARRVHIRIQHKAGTLRIEVADDGIGGADPASGTGLRGVERRLGAFDGILAISSAPGGPTMIVMEVPCALSSPKTCSC